MAEGVQQQRASYRVVVGFDYSELAELALERAFELATERGNAEVHVMSVHWGSGAQHILELTGDLQKLVTLDEAADHLKEHVEGLVRGLFERHGPVGFRQAVTYVAAGAPGRHLVQLAADLEADLIVVGTHGRRGVSRVMLGSVAESVMRSARCPVLVVRRKSYPHEEPEIQPPCPRCVEERAATGGAELWCEQHRHRHGRRHVYYNVDRVSGYPRADVLPGPHF